MRRTELWNELNDYIRSLDIIDTHEHLPANHDDYPSDHDFLKEYAFMYFRQDLVSSGFPEEKLDELFNPEIPVIERWDMVEKYWKFCSNTGYCRYLNLAAEDLYGIDHIGRDTIEELSDRFRRTCEEKDRFDHIFHKARIRACLLDNPSWNYDKNYFTKSCRLDHFIIPKTLDEFYGIEKFTGITLSSFRSFLDACDRYIDIALERGVRIFKMGLAYERSLYFPHVTYSEAEKDFNDALEYRRIPMFHPHRFAIGKNCQDYMMHYILDRMNREGNIVYQFHTGLLAGNGNLIQDSDPALLSNLFLLYPEVKFDIFHIGYPYCNMMSSLAKNFSNVFIDMCWAHIISPTASINALVEYLDAVPVNKILGFGGDSDSLDAMYGHQLLARDNMTDALYLKIKQGYMDMETAMWTAERILYSNCIDLYGDNLNIIK